MELETLLLALILVLTPCTLIYLIVKSKRRKITFGVIISLLLGLFFFCHVSAESSVKAKAFFDGYPISSLSTPLSKMYVTSNEEHAYRFKDKLGGLGYSTKKGLLGLWYVNRKLIVD